jgi:predicted aspartyl protease
MEEAGRQRSKQVRGVASDVQKSNESFVKQYELQDSLKQLENNIQQQLCDFLQVISVNSQQSKTKTGSQFGNEPAGLRIAAETEIHNRNQSSARRPSGCWKCGDPNHHKRDCNVSTIRRGSDPVSGVSISSNQDSTNNRSSAANRLAVGLDNADVYIRMELNGKSLPCLVDSGCEISLVPHHVVTNCRSLKLNSSSQRIFAANGTEIEVIGEVVLPLMLNGRQVDTPALVSPDVEEIVLGVDWLKSHACVWDFGQSRIQVDGHTVIPLSVRKTVHCRRAYTAQDVLQPKQQVEMEARATTASPRRVKSDWALESRQIKDGVYVARTLLPKVHRGLRVRMVNTKRESDVLRRGTFLENMTPADVIQSDEVPLKIIDEKVEPVAINEAVSATVDECVNGLSEDLEVEQVQQVRKLLLQFSDIWSLNEYDVGRTTLVEHSIDTGDHRPLRQASRRHPQAHLQAIDDQVEEMKLDGITEPAASPWVSNVVLETGCNQISETKYDDFVDKMKDRLHGAFDIVRKHLGQAALRNKKYYDLRVKPATYQVGDLVYYYNPRRTKGLQEKWQKKFTGPFEVIKLLGPVNLLIRRSPRARPFVVHMDKVQPFIGEDKTDETHERDIATRNQQDDQFMKSDQLEFTYDPYGVTPTGNHRPRRQIRRPRRFEY